MKWRDFLRSSINKRGYMYRIFIVILQLQFPGELPWLGLLVIIE